jgi:antitoxin (DNA-binding transcriptional repressor) of toxin-antitoxin stability system
MSERPVSITEAARELPELVEAARARHESTVLVKDGEAVARIVPFRRGITGRELAEIWPTLTHLTPEDAERFEAELNEARRFLIPPTPKWE